MESVLDLELMIAAKQRQQHETFVHWAADALDGPHACDEFTVRGSGIHTIVCACGVRWDDPRLPSLKQTWINHWRDRKYLPD